MASSLNIGIMLSFFLCQSNLTHFLLQVHFFTLNQRKKLWMCLYVYVIYNTYVYVGVRVYTDSMKPWLRSEGNSDYNTTLQYAVLCVIFI